MKITEIKGTITTADGQTREFSIGTDFGWQQWGNTTERLGDTVAALDAIVSGLQAEEIPFASDYATDEEV